MIAANFRKCPEAMAAQMCFDFYAAFELLAQLPTKLQQQATALAAWAARKTITPDAKKPCITERLWNWIKKCAKSNYLLQRLIACL